MTIKEINQQLVILNHNYDLGIRERQNIRDEMEKLFEVKRQLIAIEENNNDEGIKYKLGFQRAKHRVGPRN